MLCRVDMLQQQEFAAYREKNESVTLNYCQIQKSRYGGQIEVMVNRSTKVSTSPRKFGEMVKSNILTDKITLEQLQTVQNNQCISVTVKVLHLEPKMEVKPDLYKQDVTVADSTGTVRLTLWQDVIGKLEVDKSYLVENLLVKSFNNVKYLTPPKSGCRIVPKDIGQVEEESDSDKNEWENAEVIGITHIGCHVGCITSKEKINPLNDKIGVCSKCSMTQHLDKCTQQLSAKLLVAAGDKTRTVVAFIPIIRLITQDDTLTDLTSIDEITTQLLMSDPFTMTYTPRTSSMQSTG